MAGGDGGILLTSTDGLAWQPVASGTPCRIAALAARDGWIVGVGDAGTILASRDGLAWEPRASGGLARLSGVGAAGPYFVAVGEQGMILTSIIQQPNEVGLVLPSAPDKGPFVFTAFGPPDVVVAIQASPDLETWYSFGQVSGSLLPARMLGHNHASGAAMFYRAQILSR